MVLSEDDGKLFYKLWLPLLAYVNYVKNINHSLTDMDAATAIRPREAKEVADVLWDEPQLIDEYLSDHPEIDGVEREILASWKRRVKDKFFVERHLKKGTILISGNTDEIYLVLGITSSWEYMTRYARLPIVVDATLIPFKSVIISDGLVGSYSVSFGGNITQSLKESYMAAKKAGRIRKSL